MLLFSILFACENLPDEIEERAAPTSEGTALWIGDQSVLVLHQTTRDRTTVGVEHYAATADLAGLKPGTELDLWVARDTGGWGTVTGWRAKGSAALPVNFDPAGHPLTGTVVRVDEARITVDHEAIPGVMMGMVMPFDVLPSEATSVKPSDRIFGTLLETPHGFHLVDIHKIGTGDADLRKDVEAVDNGAVFPELAVAVESGGVLQVGPGQDKPLALTYIYTTCPDPNFCPAVAARMAALQEAVGTDARILTITIDPRIDSFPILKRYGQGLGANPEIWSFGRLDPVHLQRAAMLSGLSVTERGGKIEHLLRLLILDADGRLIERYDDNEWPLERVVSQLRSGEPKGPQKTGTLKSKP